MEPDPAYPNSGYWRCTACGFVRLPATARDYSDQYFADYPGGGQAYDADREQRAFEASRRADWVSANSAPGSLLEVGAASGYFCAAMQARGYAVTGIEPAAGVAASAQQLNGVHVDAMMLDQIHATARQFDTVCAWHVVEHLDDPRSSAAMLFDLTKPGGQLFIEVPNIDSAEAHRRGEQWLHLDPPNHVCHYKPSTLAHLFRTSGFVDVATHTIRRHIYARGGWRTRADHLRDMFRTGTIATDHPTRHEMLRLCARRPA